MKKICKSRKTSRPAKRPCDTVQAIKKDVLANLVRNKAKFAKIATKSDFYYALAYAVRERLLQKWVESAQTYYRKESRTLAYLSAEYLVGPQLGNHLLCLGIYDEARKAVCELGLNLDELLEEEEEPGLGNGGLGRLAACYMDSMATLQIPAMCYGIRYEYGIFDQEIHDGWQVEVTDKWLRMGNPWEIAHPEIQYRVGLGGRTEAYSDEKGRFRVRWLPERGIMGTAHDMPVLGYGVDTANMLRLWKADACESFDLQAFNSGEYYRAVEEKVRSENLSRVLYPNDQPTVGKELRLAQEYFFVSCSLQDMLRIYFQRAKRFDKFCDKYTVQLNDTHPAIGVAELMRLLVDEHGLEWDEAWRITTRSFAYTNHTLLPEALEKWPLPIFGRLLPRHLEIIYEINRRFLEEARTTHGCDDGMVSRLSLIDESGEKYVRMANLACVGSRKINGVSRLHSELLKETVLSDFYRLWPERFCNVTNGITPRRFLALSNPALSKLVTGKIGDKWIGDAERLVGLEKFAGDKAFLAEWRKAKRANKDCLIRQILSRTGVEVNPDSMFDIQVKRIHEYKRQHLNVLRIVTLYNRIKRSPGTDMQPRTFIFGGKAAPGYYMAKLVIKLINSVAAVVNNDPEVRGMLKVVFFPDFNVKNAQHIYPAAEVSEQISTAGMEASGTGNMKFALNGALTMGTLDGANVEIREAVGAENFFLFGLTAEEVALRKCRGYRPWECYEQNAELRGALDAISSGVFSNGDRELFQPLVRSLLERDEYLLLADYESYMACDAGLVRAYADRTAWTKMSVLNVARVGRFSSDRSIRDYAEQIWKIKPVRV